MVRLDVKAVSEMFAPGNRMVDTPTRKRGQHRTDERVLAVKTNNVIAVYVCQ